MIPRFTFATPLLLATLFAAGGCQDQLMSDDRMGSAIAGTLGVPPSDVTLTDRRSDGPTNTFVTAHVRNGGTYACTVNGGGALAFGMINPPMCHPAGTAAPVGTGPFGTQ
jgi:hypothetical protein